MGGRAVLHPEGALKTLVSRTRTILSNIAPELGSAIFTERGSTASIRTWAFRWTRWSLKSSIRSLRTSVAGRRDPPEVQPDAVAVSGRPAAGLEQEDWVVSRSVYLHSQYLKMVLPLLDMLKEAKDFERMIHVCRLALDVDVSTSGSTWR